MIILKDEKCLVNRKNYYNMKTCIRINTKYNRNGPQHKSNHTQNIIFLASHNYNNGHLLKDEVRSLMWMWLKYNIII